MNADDDQESLSERVDSRVPRELETPDMTESLLLAELERIEASIAEIRKQELAVADRLVQVHQENDELVAARATLEEAANLIRRRLGKPASAVVVQLATPRPAQQAELHRMAVAPPRRRRGVRPGSDRDKGLQIIKEFLLERGGSAPRREIKDKLLEGGLFEDAQNVESSIQNLLLHLKNYGHITNNYRGQWSLVCFEKTRTAEP